MKALTEEAEKVGIESRKADLASVEKNTTKKKVRIVKKIVKRTVIRKVPKRVPVASHCNEIEKVAIPNPIDHSPMEIEASVMVEIEKPNLVVNDSREAEDMKEFEVSNKDNDVCLVESNDCCRDESERSGLVTASPLNDQNQIELLDSSHAINTMGVEEHEDEDTKVDESVKEHTERSECDGAKPEGDSSNGDRGEDEQVEKTEEIDMTLSDAVEPGDEVNSEPEGLKSQEGSSEKQVETGELVASRLHMKHMAKIFIHGLDNETKEEDIRKVFEEVGEVVEVKLITNFRSGKSRGCGHIRYASADLAKLALKKYNSVEICGRLCHTAAVEGSDMILLNNIDKNWNNEHVITLLQKIGIKNIDEVSVVPDPKNPKLNRGFAYLELETKRDAQIVYRKLQNKNIFGNHSNIKVTWAPPLTDPVEEEMHSTTTTTTNNNNNNNNGYSNNDNSKSVRAVNIPATWDEKEVRDYFGTFGEIESIALAKNLRSTNRNDFAFVNYKTCEGAMLCVEALTCRKSTDGKGIKVSLTKSISKVKPVKAMSGSSASEVKQKSYHMPHKPQNMKIASVSRHEDGRRKGETSSTTDELVRILREQASWKHAGPQGVHHHQQQRPFGGQQQFTQLGSKSLYDDPQPQTYHQPHLQIPNPTHLRPTGNGVAITLFRHVDPQQQHTHYTSGSLNPRYFQTRDQPGYHGSSNSIYRQKR